MVAAAVVGGVSAASIGGSALAASAAADAQKNAAEKGIAAQQAQYAQTRNDLMPYQTLGQAALPQLQGLLGGDPAKLSQTLTSLPGYQFDLNQGLQAVQSSAAARGLGSSGAALQGAANYATGLADNTLNSQYNRLLGAANLGEGAAAQTGQFGQNTANQITGAYQTIGNAQAAADMAPANALNSIAGMVDQAYLKDTAGLYGR